MIVRRKISKFLKSLGVSLGLRVGVVLCLLVAVGFFSAALWIALSELASSLVAAVVLGFVYAGAGLLMVAAIISRKRRPSEVTKEQTPDVLRAFFEGFAQGSKASRKSR